MALADRKIEAAAIVGHRVVDRPDTASNQAETVKGWFDDLPVNFIIPAVNDTIDDLSATTDGASGADQIGATPIVSGGASTVQGIFDEIFSRVYPIGSIYMSVDNTSPATLFGGTWAAFAPGRVLVGVDAGQTEFNTVQKTGGEKTHTTTLPEMPEHDHHETTDIIRYGGTVANPGAYLNGGPTTPPPVYHTNNGTAYTAETLKATGKAGGNAAHNNLQPYITCYMWKRTA